MPKSTFAKNVTITSLLRTGTVYAALYITDPTDADTGTEVSAGDYSRKVVTFGIPVDGVTANDILVDFIASAASAWGLLTHIGFRDALTGGNLVYHGPLTNPKTINIGDPVFISIGEADITES